MNTAAGNSAGPGKPGPDLGAIADGVSDAHRLWLEPMRSAYLASKLSFEEISDKSRCRQGTKRLASKGKVSELLRGATAYPRWYRVHALHDVLAPPVTLSDLVTQWSEGARAAGRPEKWIDKCLDEARGEPGLDTALATPGFAALLLGGPTAKAMMAIALLLTGLGAFLGAYTHPEPSPPGHGTRGWCSATACSTTNIPVPGGAMQTPEPWDDDRSSYYVNYPAPSDTRGMLRIVPADDVPVYSGIRRDELKGWIQAGTAFYAQCRTGESLTIAGTHDRVPTAALDRSTDTAPQTTETLPSCPSPLREPSPTPSPWK
ncbi:hypothetical protein [Streptomyces sp. CRN 30]|uniref:hypothetical protein n=1 Tax=Streptomyces sp. CRN 30 TaxID=3075613 RepID=UPI002A813E3F|nr:hypothetical protein [Streptomyces sp. CRN 30]